MIRYTTGGVSVALPCYTDMATATGGTAVDDSGAGTIGPFIIANAKARAVHRGPRGLGGLPHRLQLQPGLPDRFADRTAGHPLRRDDHGPDDRRVYTCTITAVTDPGGPTSAVETST